MRRCVLGFVCYVLVTACAFADSYTNTLPPGLSLIANQLDHGSNTFAELFPNGGGSRDGDVIQLYQCTNYVTYYFDSSSPTGFLDSNSNPISPGILAPGQGALYYNSQSGAESVTFVGTPHVSILPAALPCGFGQTNFLSRPTKGPGTYENVTGYLPQTGAIVQTWNGVSYDSYFYTGGAWSPNEPSLNVGEAAFFIVPPGSVPAPNYTLNLLTGYNLIANQLDQGGNTLGEIFPVVPDGSVIYKYDNAGARLVRRRLQRGSRRVDSFQYHPQPRQRRIFPKPHQLHHNRHRRAGCARPARHDSHRGQLFAQPSDE